MKIFPFAKKFGLFLLSMSLFTGQIGATTANAVPGPSLTPNSDSLFSAEVLSSPESLGRVERDSVKAAKAHLYRNAAAWGIDPRQFKPSAAIDSVAGMSIIRFTQSIQEIEVENSLLAVTVDRQGSLLSYTKSISDYSNSLEASITKAEAIKILKSKLANSSGISADQVEVSEINLVIVDSALVDNVPSGKYLAWLANTSITNDATSISMTYLSENGQEILSSLPFVRGITADPFVCDLQVDIATPGYVAPTGVTTDTNNNRYVNISSGLQGMPLCGYQTFGLGTPATEIAQDGIKRTWNFFNSILGQDINEEKFLGNISPIVNGDDTPRISAFINVCATNGTAKACPYGNAFWVPWSSAECRSGACSAIFLGQGFDRADDVISHELAHGVTFALAFSSAMADVSETAALSEAISDIFGEAMDQLDVQPGEAADPAWKMGEDSKASGYRSLQKPKVLKIDNKWKPGDSHDNSGPVNRLAYLLANGGKVGKVNIKAMGSTANSVIENDLCEVSLGECTGIIRMSQLLFATTSNLSASSNYFDFGKQLMNACNAFVTNKTSGFTKATCKNVGTALKAQGFTQFRLISMTQLGKVTKGADTRIVTRAISSTGESIVGQKLTLQVKRGKNWKSVRSANSNQNGRVAFTVSWNGSATYRVVSGSNSGVYFAKSRLGKATIR